MAWKCKECGYDIFRIVEYIVKETFGVIFDEYTTVEDYVEEDINTTSYKIYCVNCDNENDSIHRMAEWEE